MFDNLWLDRVNVQTFMVNLDILTAENNFSMAVYKYIQENLGENN